MTRARILLLAFVALGACRRDEPPAETRATPAEAAPLAATPPESRPATGARVSGRIVLDGPPPPHVTRTVKVDEELCGTSPVVDREMLVDPETRGLRYAVVTLTNDTAAHATPAPVTRSLEQAKCEYYPYVTVVPPGSTVVVTNADAGLHDVHVMPEAGAGAGTKPDANHTLRPDGRVELVFPEPGNVLLGCDLHYWARAWVLVDPSPFVAITGADGRYELAGIPPGVWRMTVWHDRLGTTVREITIASPTSTVVEDVALPPAAPGRLAKP